MTGTGTQNDPYIVDNWNDFLTAIAESGAYVECVPNLKWDMNDILPEGFNESNLSAASVNGHGLTIENLYCKGSGFTKNVSGGTFSGVNFKDFYVSGTDSAIFSVYNHFSTFGNCKFSGIIDRGQLYCDIRKNSVFKFSTALNDEGEPKGCSFNVRCINNGDICKSQYCEFEFAVLNFSGTLTELTSTHCYNNCFLTGDNIYSRIELWTFRGNENYDCSANTVIDLQSLSSEQRLSWRTVSSQILVNTDKWNRSFSSPVIGVTTEQLCDAAYLASIGFPIGVD